MKDIEKWKENMKKILDDPYTYDNDPNHPNCPKCGKMMNFFGPDENDDIKIDDAYWECSECELKIYEKEL